MPAVADLTFAPQKPRMPLSRQQYVRGIISAVRKSHGPLARTIIWRRIAEYRESGESQMADIWAEAYQAITQQEASVFCLSEDGYIAEQSAPRGT
jgi:hypothetical protein